MKKQLFASLILAFAVAACASASHGVKQENIFRVYFNVNETTLDDGDLTQVAKAAAAYKNGGSEVILAGHADRSGDKATNTRLSHDRSVSVTASLVKMGVPREFIVTRYFGESAPMVKTGDGVSSRDNRRVLMIVK